MVCDPMDALLQKREQEWAPVRVTKDYMEVCKDPEVDAVIVATPNDSHYAICMACIEAGPHGHRQAAAGRPFRLDQLDQLSATIAVLMITGPHQRHMKCEMVRPAGVNGVTQASTFLRRSRWV